MRELSLFTGAGGGLLGSKLLGWETVGYVENNDYCQRVIAQRIMDGILDEAPIFGDIRAFLSEGFAGAYKGMVDVVTGGFPCQPFSIAGKQLGESDPRNMWPETLAVIRAVRPKYAFLENVPNLLVHKYFGRILGDLAECGYCVSWKCLSAAEVGAPHKRKRLFLVAHPHSVRCRDGISDNFQNEIFRNEKWRDTENFKSGRQWKRWLVEVSENLDGQISSRDFYGVDDGKPGELDRFKAVGNMQVPLVVRAAWEILSGEKILKDMR